MPTNHLHSRLPALALCLCALVLAASPAAQAQTPFDVQDQADTWRRLQAQGLIRSPEPARTGAANRGEPSTPARLQEAARNKGGDADVRCHPGQDSKAQTPAATTPADTAAIDAAILSALAHPAREHPLACARKGPGSLPTASAVDRKAGA
jgi:hypothetical protein